MKEQFIKQLATYLVEDQAKKSILLEMDRPSAKAWAALRNTTPIMGYPTIEEAQTQLNIWFATWNP